MFSNRYLRNIAVVSHIAFFAVACASVNPAVTGTSQSAENTLNDKALPASKAGNANIAQDTWAKQHAAYLRTLDFAEIDRQKNVPAVYSIKTDIIDSRYHIKNSETDLTVDHDVQSALRELRSAKQLFDRAVENANSRELHLLDNSKSMLQDLIKQTELSMQNKCDSPGHSEYHLLEGNLESLLAAL